MRANFGWRQLNVGILPNEIDGDEFLTLLASKTGQASTDWLLLYYNALCTILAFIVVTRAGLEQNHWWRIFTEESTLKKNKKENIILNPAALGTRFM